jgi:hypothetical protein
VASLKMTATVPPSAKAYFRKDGSRVPGLIGVASFEGGEHEGVAFVLDLTERKRAEAEARENERRHPATPTARRDGRGGIRRPRPGP